ncbi:MAG: hypothetical protein LBB89_06045 [Treponema sp.]|jgi:hypothetical protein|nr:hypothetical protein [Treponema sp.]
MKKIIGVTVALCFVLGFAGCGSSPKTAAATTTTTTTTTAASKPERRIGGAVPQFVKDALKRTPEDALVGIGTARAASLSLARTTAATRARAEISRQMNTMIQDMVRDYSAGSEVDPKAALSFQENITVALSKSTLTGSSIVEEDQDDNGNYWVVVMLSKINTVTEINQAQAAARLAVPAMASFSAEDRMNAAFDRAYASELGVGDR